MNFKELADHTNNEDVQGLLTSHQRVFGPRPSISKELNTYNGEELLGAAIENFGVESQADFVQSALRAHFTADPSTPHHDAETFKNIAVLENEMAKRLQILADWFAVELGAAMNPYFRTSENATQEMPPTSELPEQARYWFGRMQ